MRVRKTLVRGWPGFAAASCALLMAQPVSALAAAPGGPGELPGGGMPGQVFNPGFALAPGLAPAIGSVWMAMPGAGPAVAAPVYRAMADAGDFDDDPNSPSFDIAGYRAMWDDTQFSEISAYGGLERDALRIAGMRAIDGSAGASEPIPYGRLTLARDFFDGEDQLTLGAYGTEVAVRQAALYDFGDDSYTDVAFDGAWRWTPHFARGPFDSIAAHVLVLHEGESLIASHAIFGTNRSDELTAFRGDVSWTWGANIAPMVQYFHITGTDDPVRLGTLDGSPNSNGFIAGIGYQPSGDPRSPLSWFRVRLSLDFVAYSEFDGTSHDAAHNNTVLFHLTAFSDPDS